MTGSDLAIIIRESGERTADFCRERLLAETGGGPVIAVGGGSFPDTLRRSLLAGIDAGCRWTLCVDADVVPTPGAVTALVARAEALDRPVFELQAMVLDRLFGVRRPAGNHLYRTALLPQALERIPADEMVLRPESAMILAMAAQGHSWWQDDMVFGLHDFGQWSRDIARKVYVQAAKFQRFLPFLQERFMVGAAAGEVDFLVARAALEIAATSTVRPVLDAARLADLSADILARAGIVEGPGLSASAASSLLDQAVAAGRMGPRTEAEIQFAPRLGYL